MKGSPIALLTDFGTRDPYVPAMKGVIYGLHPGALVTDISHEIPRHNVESAAYHLWSVAPFFPRGTIFVCVVDPGVGSDRRIIVLKISGRTYIAPDNGMLNYLCSSKEPGRTYALRYRDNRRGVSRTFHGRDLFAPAAARLSLGRPVISLADPAPRLVPVKLFVDVPVRSKGTITGKVLHIDHFGNIITNLKVHKAVPARSSVTIRRKTIRSSALTYSEAPIRKPFMIPGSTGLLEVSIREGRAARSLHAAVGDSVKYSPAKRS